MMPRSWQHNGVRRHVYITANSSVSSPTLNASIDIKGDGVGNINNIKNKIEIEMS